MNSLRGGENKEKHRVENMPFYCSQSESVTGPERRFGGAGVFLSH
jgi:hypothetical protein